MEIPYGYCHCGCGQKTKLNTQSDPRRGFIKGEPRKYINGHTLRNYHQSGEESPTWKGGRRIDKDGYILIMNKTHPKADSHGYVREHIVLVEEAIKQQLPDGFVIHHKNGNKADNRLSNLLICHSQAFHNEIHAEQRALDNCGNKDWKPCKFCHQYDSLENLVVLHANRKKQFYHAPCHAEYERNRRKRIKLMKVD